MDVLIIAKWLTNWKGNEHSAPNIITTMINIPLAGGYIKGSALIGDKATNQAISMLFFGKRLFSAYSDLHCVCALDAFRKAFVDQEKHEEAPLRERLSPGGRTG